MRSQLYSWLKFLIGWPFILLAFYFIFKTLYDQAPTLLSSIHQVNIPLLCLGIVCFIIFYFVRGYIWQQILERYNYKLSFRKSCYLWCVSEFKRYIPGSIWAFMGRAFQFEKEKVEKKDVARGLIIEAEVFVMGCVVVSLLALPILVPSFLHPYLIWFNLLGLLLVLGYCNAQKVVVLFPKKIQKVIAFLLPTFSFYDMLSLVITSSVALFFFGLGNYFVITAITYLDLQSIFSLIGVFVLAFLAGYLSIITPAGLGVREGIMILTLTKLIPSGLAALAAVFSRILLIISELLFMLLSFLWYKSEFSWLRRLEKRIVQYPQMALVSIAASIYAIYFSTVSFLRYDNYYTGRFDLGNMAQTVWNTYHGNLFLLTDPNGTELISRLAFHADFILVLLAPFYFFWESPKMLLLIQTVVLAAGAIFVYKITSHVLKHKNLAVVFSLVFLLNPSMQFTNLYDFHAVTLVTTFFLAAFYFFLKKRYSLLVLFLILAALCKEQIWLTVALFGVLVFLFHRQRIIGSLVFGVGLVMFYFLMWHAIPQSLGGQHFALGYLSDFGSSPTEIVKGILFSPDKIIGTLLEADRMKYLTQLFAPIGYLSILFPFFLIFAGPDLLINTLSNNPNFYQIFYQYTATITPFLFLCAIYGVWILKKLIIRYSSFSMLRIISKYFALILAVYLLSMAVRGAYLYGPLPGAVDKNTAMILKPLENKEAINAFIETIPPNHKVAASNDVGSHLSHRDIVYTIPVGVDRADMVVMLLYDPKAREMQEVLKKDSKFRKTTDFGNFVVFERVKK